MSNNNNDSSIPSCLIIIISMGLSIYFCIPIMRDLHFLAFPIVLIFGILIGKVLAAIFINDDRK